MLESNEFWSLFKYGLNKMIEKENMSKGDFYKSLTNALKDVDDPAKNITFKKMSQLLNKLENNVEHTSQEVTPVPIESAPREVTPVPLDPELIENEDVPIYDNHPQAVHPIKINPRRKQYTCHDPIHIERLVQEPQPNPYSMYKAPSRQVNYNTCFKSAGGDYVYPSYPQPQECQKPQKITIKDMKRIHKEANELFSMNSPPRVKNKIPSLDNWPVVHYT